MTTKTTNQGGLAVKSGKLLENAIEDILKQSDVEYVTQKPFESVYGKTSRMDFYVTLSDGTRIAIESKNQNVSGTVDEKIPYVMLNLQKFDADVGILVMDGTHFETVPQIKNWAKQFAHDFTTRTKLLKAMSLEEFKEWIIEQTETRCAA